MRFVAILVLFVLAVAGFTVLAKYAHQGSVEAELELLAHDVLRDAGFPGVKVTLDHLDGSVGGYVDRSEDREKVVRVLSEKVPAAYWPPADETNLTIRPTLPPMIRIRKEEGESSVSIEGLLAVDEDANRMLLGARVHGLDAIETVDNTIELDPMRLPFPKTAELASLASSLVSNSDAAEIVLEDGTLRVAGTVANDGLKKGLLELAALIEPTSVEDEIQVAAPVTLRKPSHLSVTRNRFGVILTGSVGSEASRTALIETFASLEPVPRVTDRIEIDGDVSASSWETHAGKLIPLLCAEFLGEMTVEFTERQVRLNGAVSGEEARDEILSALAPLKEASPKLEILADIQVDQPAGGKASAVKIQATLEGELLTLSGLVPDLGFFSALETQVEAVRPEVAVKNSIEVSPTAPPADWLVRLPEFFAEALARVKEGTFVFDDKTVKLEGKTIAASDRLILQNVAINTVPAGYSIENSLAHIDQPFPQPELQPEARTKLSESLEKFPIYFDTNSEIVGEKEKPKVEAIANAIRETGATPDLVITGFADNVGNAAYNEALSLRRANAVLAILIELGFEKDSIVTRSVGEDVSGVDRSERWKARRVEVSLADSEGAETPEN